MLKINRQNQILSFTICMLGVVGVFNGLNALGGGGLDDHLMCTKMQTMYTLTLGLTGWCGGPIFNKLGAQWSVLIGAIPYCAYVLTIVGVTFYNWRTEMIYLSGIFVGLGAGVMWTCFGSFSIAYPRDSLKGFIGIWTSLNLGTAVLAIAGTLNNASSNNRGLTQPTYTVLLCLMVGSALFAVCTLTHQKVRTVAPAFVKYVLIEDSPITGVEESGDQPASDSVIPDLPVLLLLSPLALSPNAHYPFLFNGLNAQYFNIRSRSLNTAIYSLFRIPGSILILYLFTLTQTTMTGLYSLAFSHVTIFNTFGNVSEPGGQPFDAFADTYRSALLVICFVVFALLDSLAQALMYAVMGKLARDRPRKAAIYSACYKQVQAIGLCMYWGLEWWLTVHETAIQKYTRYRIHWLSLAVQWTVSIPAALLGLLILHTQNVCGHCGSESINSKFCLECSCHLMGKCQGRCQACKE